MCPADKFGLLEIQRNDEFAPIKNANGNKDDTPQTAKKLLCDRDRRWLEKYGLVFTGQNDGCVEISPMLTYFGENLEESVKIFKN